MTNPEPTYRISKCEDTGRLALYQSYTLDGVVSWILLFHEEDFFRVFGILSHHFIQPKND